MDKSLTACFKRQRRFTAQTACLLFGLTVCHVSSDEPPLLPLVSILKTFDLAFLRYESGEFYVTPYLLKIVKAVSLRDHDKDYSISAYDCWKNGHDLTYLDYYDDGRSQTILCEPSANKEAVDAGSFLKSILPVYGNYLSSCRGLLRTIENNQEYLYGRCRELFPPVYHVDDPVPVNMHSDGQRLNITDCMPGQISNIDGKLTCQKGQNKPRHILSGSYLKDCYLTNTYYDPENLTLTTSCLAPLKGSNARQIIMLNLPDADQCIGSGNDIVLENDELRCIKDSTQSVVLHESSLYLPSGSYPLTCTDIAYFPCLDEGKGLLSARCRFDTYHEQVTSLSDMENNSDCKSGRLGYVTNSNGELKCDPSVTFDASIAEGASYFDKDGNPVGLQGLPDLLSCQSAGDAMNSSK